MEEFVRALGEEARRADQRRLLVLAGAADACRERVPDVLAAADLSDPVVVGHRDIGGTAGEDGDAPLDRVTPARSGDLLGTTRDCVVLDCHDETRPNAVGRASGVVDGGGLLVLLAPPLDAWPDRPDRFDDALAVPPYAEGDVAGRFRRRLVALLREHPAVSVVDADAGTVERDGRTDPDPAPDRTDPTPPPRHDFPQAAYDRCLTADQVTAVRAFERLQGDDAARDGSGAVPPAVVVEADRGRGKSSAAGLAAGALAAAGRDVLVTAPAARGTDELFARARELLAELDALSDDGSTSDAASPARDLRSTAGGRVRFASPVEAATLPGDPDAVFVDEAAGVAVGLLAAFLGRVPVGYTTTVHGYEGAGRGFSVRFRERLRDHADVTEREMREPIRYAVGDPVESWSFRALALDARPAVDAAVADATVDSAEYGRPTAEDLLADEHLLREAFGLLVLAHYRTEPDDLGRLLDAPNLSARTLTHEGRVVAVVMLAREGGLSDEGRRAAYEGGRVRGNMLPDLLSGQLRDPDAAGPVGVRTVRIAVHPAVRSRGLGSHLLERVHAEFRDDVDWFGVGYGTTPRLLRFWAANGYRVVHLSATRNETSGEHSAAMLRPAGDDCPLCDRHGRWFRERVGDCLTDSLRDLAPDVVRAALAASDHAPPDLSDREWRVVVSAAHGPGQFDPYPGPFRRLVLAWLTDPGRDPATDGDALGPDAERLLVRRILQGWSWEDAAADLGFHSASAARKALGRSLRPLVERYGTKAARDERSRYG